jgi:hypothetical protein
VVDERGKLPGRGAYLCAALGCLEKARKGGQLARALKAEVSDELYAQLREYVERYGERHDLSEVRRELCALLGLSRRARLLHIGIDSVKSECEKSLGLKSTPLLILTASDSSEAVREAVRRQVAGGHVHRDVPLDVEDFSSAMGASGVQVVALPIQNGLAEKIKMLLS